MSNYIECPNRGFCGHKTHRIGTKAYQECLKRAADLARSKQIRAEAAAAREVWLEEYPHMRSIEEVRDILMSGKCDSYESPDGFVTDDMRIDRRGIRTYAETGKRMESSKSRGNNGSRQISRVTCLKKWQKKAIS